MSEHVYDQESEARYQRLSDNVTKMLRDTCPEDAIEDLQAAAVRAKAHGLDEVARDFDDMGAMIRERQNQADLTLLTALQDIGKDFELS